MNRQILSMGRRCSEAALMLSLALGTGLSAANAALLYEQAPRDGGEGLSSSQNGSGQSADNFSLGAKVSIDAITWWGRPIPSQSGAEVFTIRIFNDLTGNPETDPSFEKLAQSIAGVPSSINNGEVLEYTLDLSSNPLILTGGRHYLSVVNEDLSFEWFWHEDIQNSGDSTNWFRANDADQWEVDDFSGQDLAFRISGDRISIPEPGMLSLMAWLVAGGGYSAFRGRRRKLISSV